MNDRKKVLLLMKMLQDALMYLRVVCQKQDPEQCAIPLSLWIDRVLYTMERVNFLKEENE